MHFWEVSMLILYPKYGKTMSNGSPRLHLPTTVLAGLARMQELGFEAENIRLVGGGSRSRSDVDRDADVMMLHLGRSSVR